MTLSTRSTCVCCQTPLTFHERVRGSACDQPRCQALFRRLIAQGKKFCLICGTILSVHQEVRGAICDSQLCIQTYLSQRQASQKVCVVCNQQLTVVEAARGELCGNLACNVAFRAREKQKRDSDGLAEFRKRCAEAEILAVDARKQAAETAGVSAPETYPLLVIPANSRRLTNLSHTRRSALRDHLMKLVSEAAAELAQGQDRHQDENSEASPKNNGSDVKHGELQLQPDELDFLGGLCATCQGYCCMEGGDRAYLDVKTIRRYMQQHPKLRPRHVLDAFLSRLSNKTYVDSCVYHSQTGCGLTREMRSDLCNRHFCGPLKDFHAELSQSNRRRAFAYAINLEEPVRAAFVDQKDVRFVQTANE